MAIGMGDSKGLYGYSIKSEVRFRLSRRSCLAHGMDPGTLDGCWQLSKLAGTCKEPPKEKKKKRGAPESDL